VTDLAKFLSLNAPIIAWEYCTAIRQAVRRFRWISELEIGDAWTPAAPMSART
jgi:hypothetical protein